jgi:hypothetical protein
MFPCPHRRLYVFSFGIRRPLRRLAGQQPPAPCVRIPSLWAASLVPNSNRWFRPASGTGRTVGLILTIAVLCAVGGVIKDCHGGGHMVAPATENRGSVVITDLRATVICVVNRSLFVITRYRCITYKIGECESPVFSSWWVINCLRFNI